MSDTLVDQFTEPGESEWITFRGKFNFCLANPDPLSPQSFPAGVEIALVAKFDGDSQEYFMNGPEGNVYSKPGVYVVDIPEPRMDFKLVALAVPNGTTVKYRLSR